MDNLLNAWIVAKFNPMKRWQMVSKENLRNVFTNQKWHFESAKKGRKLNLPHPLIGPCRTEDWTFRGTLESIPKKNVYVNTLFSLLSSRQCRMAKAKISRATFFPGFAEGEKRKSTQRKCENGRVDFFTFLLWDHASCMQVTHTPKPPPLSPSFCLSKHGAHCLVLQPFWMGGLFFCARIQIYSWKFLVINFRHIFFWIVQDYPFFSFSW